MWKRLKLWWQSRQGRPADQDLGVGAARVRDMERTNAASGAGAVFNDDSLAGFGSQVRCEQPRQQVSGAAGRRGNHQAQQRCGRRAAVQGRTGEQGGKKVTPDQPLAPSCRGR